MKKFLTAIATAAIVATAVPLALAQDDMSPAGQGGLMSVNPMRALQVEKKNAKRYTRRAVLKLRITKKTATEMCKDAKPLERSKCLRDFAADMAGGRMMMSSSSSSSLSSSSSTMSSSSSSAMSSSSSSR